MGHRLRLKAWRVVLFLTALCAAQSAGAHASPPYLEQSIGIRLAEIQVANQLLGARKAGLVYPDVPPVEELSISNRIVPRFWCNSTSLTLSAGLQDPILERARDLRVFDDFKIVSDMRMKDLSSEARQRAAEQARAAARGALDVLGAESAYLKAFIEAAYEVPVESHAVADLAPVKWRMNSGDARVDAAFAYTENTWQKLLRHQKPAEGGSLLPSPYPVLIPAGRFQEAYYWDSYFAIRGLLATERLDIAQMQAENLLSYVRMYGFVPNGGRDYLLSRSQPPFLSSIVRTVYERSLADAPGLEERERLHRWLRERAYPLVKRDYENFWMNPRTHLDAGTGLNHHCDDVNLPRPERHGADQELALGKDYRDARAAAESGLDFTDAFAQEASHIAGPLLNAMLFKTERDLAWMATTLQEKAEATAFAEAADRRMHAMGTYLWDERKGRFEAYHLVRKKRMGILSAETFAPLFAGAATPAQAARVRANLHHLERRGGIMASELVHSKHQWDGTNGWAPFQVMAMEGLMRYGYKDDAKRLAGKWVNAVARTHAESGSMYERLDVERLRRPPDDPHKYPAQEGFLWTNGSFTWAAVEVLGYELLPEDSGAPS